jgi:lipopolysaccharide/colanic/teichoic acid biosynthesis glycosyltransferase
MNPVLEQPMRAANGSGTRTFLANGDGATFVWPKPIHDTRGAARAASRILNIVIASVALVLCAPLLLVIAVLVRLSSQGPIIYKQTRVGIDRRLPGTGGGDSRRKVDYGGRLFQIYKFRTMRSNPNSDLQVWADPNDKRVTAVGRILRQYRLDELPQLVNVIKGDMNVVGPRPEQPKIFLSLQQQISGYKHRQRVLPGITGWAQINHHYDRSVEDVKRKVAFDLEYIEQQGPLHDLRILAKTIPVVLLRRGAW